MKTIFVQVPDVALEAEIEELKNALGKALDDKWGFVLVPEGWKALSEEEIYQFLRELRGMIEDESSGEPGARKGEASGEAIGSDRAEDSAQDVR